MKRPQVRLGGRFRLAIRHLETMREARIFAAAMARSEPWKTLRRSAGDALELLTNPDREVYVAAAGDALAGLLILDMRGAFRGYIQTVLVLPELRNRGIGRRLIRFAERRVFQASPNVFLCVSSFNGRAQRLYQRLGYARVGELRDYIVKGHSEILMRKTRGPLAGFKPRAGRREAKRRSVQQKSEAGASL